MKKQAKFNSKKTLLNSKSVNKSLEMESRMRLIANLIIDRIFEDKAKDTLKFQLVSKSGATPVTSKQNSIE